MVKREGEDRLGDDEKGRRGSVMMKRGEEKRLDSVKREGEEMLGDVKRRGVMWQLYWCSVHQQTSKERCRRRGAGERWSHGTEGGEGRRATRRREGGEGR